jgi:hypothetical protein
MKVVSELFLMQGIKFIPMAAIKCTLGAVQMAMLLFEQYVFIGKSVNKTTYSDCSTVLDTDKSTVFVNCNSNITTK